MPTPHALYAFEADDGLSLVPLAARRALDLAGEKLSLEGWRSLGLVDRWALVEAGAKPVVEPAQICAIVTRADPKPTPQDPVAEPDPLTPPPELLRALGEARPLAPSRWARLRPLDRYSLAKLAVRSRSDKLGLAYDELLGEAQRPNLTHLNERGEANMVDVGQKPATHRRAVATALVRMSAGTLEAIQSAGVAKGDVLGVARVAGIQAAKRTSELIPLCHMVALTRVEVSFEPLPEASQLRVRASAQAHGQTGVEMEALVAASVAALTIYDMTKSIDRWMTVTDIGLEEKSGGKSGTLSRGAP